jgi:hypothetical protein
MARRVGDASVGLGADLLPADKVGILCDRKAQIAVKRTSG